MRQIRNSQTQLHKYVYTTMSLKSTLLENLFFSLLKDTHITKSCKRFLFLRTTLSSNYCFACWIPNYRQSLWTDFPSRKLGLTPDLKWNPYIRSIAKDARKMVGFLYCSRKIRDSFTWAGSDREWSTVIIFLWEMPSLYFPVSMAFKSVSKVLWVIFYISHPQPFSHRRHAASLLLLWRYIHGMFPGELNSLVPSGLTFRARPLHDIL